MSEIIKIEIKDWRQMQKDIIAENNRSYESGWDACKKTLHNWISVKDRLPDNMQIVLVIHEIGADYEFQVTVCRFEGDDFISESGLNLTYHLDQCDPDDSEFPVTHWMPLPEPPKENHNE